MIAKVTYVGFFPLGAEVSLRNTKIMQQEWNRCPVPVLAIGKKHFVDPMFEEVYYVKHDGQAVFFVANMLSLKKALAFASAFDWCRQWDSNPHDVSTNGF